MPVTVKEKLGSGQLSKDDSGEAGSAELTYDIEGTADEDTALTSLKSAAPATHKGMNRQECGVEPTDDKHRWTGTARYALDPADSATRFSFDTGGGSQHVTNGLATVSKTPAPGKTAPDFKGAIGVTPDNVEGVDITTPVFNFELTKYLDSVTTAYLGDVYALTGKVNNAQVVLTVNGATLTFAAGELLFLGASGGKTVGKGQWEVTYRFAASPNRTNIAVGDITVPAKKGWEYLWVRYEDAEDAAAKALVKRPLAAYVEQVYETGDFSKL